MRRAARYLARENLGEELTCFRQGGIIISRRTSLTTIVTPGKCKAVDDASS